jgi:hypothetical protein
VHFYAGDHLDEVAVASLPTREGWHALAAAPAATDGCAQLVVGFADRRDGSGRVIAHTLETGDG